MIMIITKIFLHLPHVVSDTFLGVAVYLTAAVQLEGLAVKSESQTNVLNFNVCLMLNIKS